MNIPMIDLADGSRIPQIGLGLWQVKDKSAFTTSVDAALQAGYRHFDTAQAYENEAMLGDVLRKSGVKREDLFITTKIAVTHFGHKKAKESFEQSLLNLQTDYVDLLLLHFPVTLLRKGAWKALGEIKAAGGARSIGVSNYTVRHLEEMKHYSDVTPAVNQVELHVFLQQPELVEYCRKHDIAVEAYSPLAHAQAMDNQTIAGIAKKHGKTYAQIMLRWLVEKGFVIIPKSVTPARIQENIAVFDFKLDKDDMKALETQDQDLRTCWSPVHVP